MLIRPTKLAVDIRNRKYRVWLEGDTDGFARGKLEYNVIEAGGKALLVPLDLTDETCVFVTGEIVEAEVKEEPKEEAKEGETDAETGQENTEPAPKRKGRPPKAKDAKPES